MSQYKSYIVDGFTREQKAFLFDTYNKIYPNLVRCLFKDKRRLPNLHWKILFHDIDAVKEELTVTYSGPSFKKATYDNDLDLVDGMHVAAVSGCWDIVLYLLDQYNKNKTEELNPYSFLYLYAESWSQAKQLYHKDVSVFGPVYLGNLLSPVQKMSLKNAPYEPYHFTTLPQIRTLSYYAKIFDMPHLEHWKQKIFKGEDLDIFTAPQILYGRLSPITSVSDLSDTEDDMPELESDTDNDMPELEYSTDEDDETEYESVDLTDSVMELQPPPDNIVLNLNQSEDRKGVVDVEIELKKPVARSRSLFSFFKF